MRRITCIFIFFVICSFMMTECRYHEKSKQTNDTLLCSAFIEDSFQQFGDYAYEYYLSDGKAESQARWVVGISDHTVRSVLFEHMYLRMIIDESEKYDTLALSSKPILYENNFFEITKEQEWNTTKDVFAQLSAKYKMDRIESIMISDQPVDLVPFLPQGKSRFMNVKDLDTCIIRSKVVKDWNELLNEYHCPPIVNIGIMSESKLMPPKDYPFSNIVESIKFETSVVNATRGAEGKGRQ